MAKITNSECAPIHAVLEILGTDNCPYCIQDFEGMIDGTNTEPYHCQLIGPEINGARVCTSTEFNDCPLITRYWYGEQRIAEAKRKAERKERRAWLEEHPPAIVICDVCGHRIKGHTKAIHIKEQHPEYSFTRERCSGSGSFMYKCKTCGKTQPGFGALVKHYQQCHPEKILSPVSRKE